jgi:hypothetical protein
MSNTHDFTETAWGHNLSILNIEDGGLSITLAGWGMGLSNDDYIIIKNGDDTTRYKLDSVEYKRDPTDMWFASASFAPRD